MNLMLRFLVLAFPIAFIGMFYVLLSTEDTYPGADYKVFEIPESATIYVKKILTLSLILLWWDELMGKKLLKKNHGKVCYT